MTTQSTQPKSPSPARRFVVVVAFVALLTVGLFVTRVSRPANAGPASGTALVSTTVNGVQDDMQVPGHLHHGRTTTATSAATLPDQQRSGEAAQKHYFGGHGVQ